MQHSLVMRVPGFEVADGAYNRTVPTAERSVEEIVGDIQRGHQSESNYRELHQRFCGQVYRFFLRKGCSPEDSRDLAQETFFLAFRGVKDLRDAAFFPGWLFTIARNVHHSALAKRHARKRLPAEAETDERTLDSLPAPEAGSAMKSLLDREKLAGVVNALRELPEQMRRCVELRMAHECSYEEVAVVMGLSINTVKVHLHQARKKLKEKLSPYFGDLET
jgi:RNA polymerase sigma-70 factor (ECF subfamily)